ncbi:MAG: hypothetical protein KC464_18080, partial [Myxococcales bacterium]|nr:hypothetical protein [Myxococcales bacterium]
PTLPAAARAPRARALILPTCVLGAALAAGCGDDPPPVDGEVLSCDAPTTTTYRVTAVELPVDTTEVRDIGVDLDGDGRVDNATGSIFATVLDVYADRPLLQQWQAQLAPRLAGRMDWSIRIDRCPDDGAHAWLIDGRDPGVVAAMSPATGTFDAAGLTVDGGDAIVPIGALADFTGGADDGWHPASHASLALEVDGDLTMSGLVAAAIGPGYELPIAEAFAGFVQDLYDNGETAWGQDVDTDGDGQITVDEMLADQVFQIMMTPDLDLDDDGTDESLSLGATLHVTRVAP